MIGLHHAAILSLLSPVQVHVGAVPNTPTYPYRVLRLDTGFETADRLCATSNRADFFFWITSVALSREGVAIVADEHRPLLLDVRPVVAGRKCTKIRRELTERIRPDEEAIDPETNRAPLYTIEGFHFISYAN